jgi:hypothetical protein
MRAVEKSVCCGKGLKIHWENEGIWFETCRRIDLWLILTLSMRESSMEGSWKTLGKSRKEFQS